MIIRYIIVLLFQGALQIYKRAEKWGNEYKSILFNFK